MESALRRSLVITLALKGRAIALVFVFFWLVA